MENKVIRFHETELITLIDDAGTPFVAVKPICDALAISDVSNYIFYIINFKFIIMNLLLFSSLQEFFSQPKWHLTPEWFLFLYFFWMSAISAAFGIRSIRDKSTRLYPVINYWLHLIPVIGFIIGMYILFTEKPLIKSELVLRMQKLLKKILPRTKHF